MAAVMNYPMTHQGVRDLDNPLPPSRVNVGPSERALSTLGGAVLTGVALGTRGLTGLLLGTVGAGLICRGMNGHCAVYDAMGINTAR